MQQAERSNETKPSSDRGFGFVFCVVFSLIALWPLLSGGSIRWWAVIVAGLLGAASQIIPSVLRPLNLMWFRFGMLLHAIVSPLTLGLIFFGLVLPTGLLLRIFGKDNLDIKMEPVERKSYWIKRSTSEAATASMRNQF